MPNVTRFMDMETVEWVITAYRSDLAEAERRLAAFLEDTCPRVHQVVQHRDRKPPWCDSCGRTARGIKIGEVP